MSLVSHSKPKLSRLRHRLAHQSDLVILIVIAAFRLALHTFTNQNYGFHRDELAFVDDAKHLAWGYVAYPPVTPFIARIELILFGPSLPGIRFFAALAQSIAMILSGLMAKQLGGSRRAIVLAAVAMAIAPLSLAAGALFQYVSFDFLWWVLIAYLMIRLIKSDDPRWWLAIGATIGLGMLTKYTIAFYVAGIVVGVLLTSTRRHLVSPWLWAGVAISLLVFLPNLIWQLHHNFISIEFLQSIHKRDVANGRANDFLLDQIKICINIFTLPLVVAGLYFYLVSDGRRYRILAWMFILPLILFFVARGRGYYMAAAYPMLISSGAVLWDSWFRSLTLRWYRAASALTWSALAIGGALAFVVAVPVAPVNSRLWKIVSGLNNDFKEEIGWPELVQTTATVYRSLPQEDQQGAGILTGNYGEAGAINLYGSEYGLPGAISGVNSYWLRGYGNPPPQTVIVLGLSNQTVHRLFESCELAGHISNKYGVMNEETMDHPDIFVCRRLRQSWDEFWKTARHYG